MAPSKDKTTSMDAAALKKIQARGPLVDKVYASLEETIFASENAVPPAEEIPAGHKAALQRTVCGEAERKTASELAFQGHREFHLWYVGAVA